MWFAHRLSSKDYGMEEEVEEELYRGETSQILPQPGDRGQHQ